MTCIVGVADAKTGIVRLGSDSASSDGWRIDSAKTPKLQGFKYEHRSNEDGWDLVIGYTTSWRMGQLLMQGLALPSRGVGELDHWLVTAFVPAVRNTLKEGGFATVSANVETGGNFLLGAEGRLFTVQSDYSVTESARGIDACGSGEMAALAAMAAGADLDAALEVAADLVATVQGPFHFIETRGSA